MINQNWTKLFRPEIISRGFDYWRDERVDINDKNDSCIKAVVHGTSDYDVVIKLNSDGIIDNMSCTCPYAEDGKFCKHMAALLFQIEESEGRSKIPKRDEDELSSENQFENALNKLSLDDMREIIRSEAQKNYDFRSAVIAKSSGYIRKNSYDQWEFELDNIVDEHCGADGYIEYKDALDFMYSCLDYIERIKDSFGKHAAAEDLFELGYIICEMLTELNIDASDGILTTLFSYSTNLWHEAYLNADLTKRQKMYTRLCELASWDEDSLFESEIYDFIFSTFTGEQFDSENLCLIDDLIESHNENGHYFDMYMRDLIMSRLDIMTRMGLPESEISAFRKKYIYITEVRKQCAELACEKHDYNNAIAIIEDGIQTAQGQYGLLSDYSEFLLEIYDKAKMHDEYKAELIYNLKTFSQQSIDYAEKLKRLTAPEEWPGLLDELIEYPSLRYIRYDLLAAEQRWNKMTDCLKSGADKLFGKYGSPLDCLKKYGDILVKYYPDDIFDVYSSQLDIVIGQSMNRNDYNEAVNLLKRVRNLPDGKPHADKIAESWKTKYPRRSALLDELKKGGF